MSVELTRLPSGLVVITDAMPHLETASLGVWVGSGSRDEAPDEHGISHFLEHMAFKGTKRRSAREIAEQIEAVGGDLNAATGVETTAYYARVPEGRCAARARRRCLDILSEPTFDPDDLSREKNVILQEIGASEDTPGRHHLRAFSGDRVSRSAGRPHDHGYPRNREGARPQAVAHLPASSLSQPRHGDLRGGRSVASADCGRSGTPVSSVRRAISAPQPVPAKFVGGTRIEKPRPGAGSSRARLRGFAAGHSPRSTACRFLRACWAAECRRGCSRRSGKFAGLCYSVYAFHAPYHDTGLFAIYAGTDPNDLDELMRVCAAEIEKAAETMHRGGSRCAPRSR